MDQFLFVDRRGVCEHFVSALVVMLRSVWGCRPAWSPVMAAAVLGWGCWLLWRWRRARLAARPRGLHDHPNRRRIFAIYRSAQRRLRARRVPAQTVQEHAAAHPELAGLAAAVDVAAYRPEPPEDEWVERAKGWRRL